MRRANIGFMSLIAIYISTLRAVFPEIDHAQLRRALDQLEAGGMLLLTGYRSGQCRHRRSDEPIGKRRDERVKKE